MKRVAKETCYKQNRQIDGTTDLALEPSMFSRCLGNLKAFFKAKVQKWHVMCVLFPYSQKQRKEGTGTFSSALLHIPRESTGTTAS